ncbi:MAG: hypothetical protein Q9191_002835 [Dirinaria sp. TL-2023a]
MSRRGLANTVPSDIKSIMSAGSSNSYDAETNPGGIVSLGVAENRLLVANFLNAHFHPTTPLKMESVSILNGVSSVIDSLAWCICDEGDGVLIGRPLYVGFVTDLENRAKVTPVYVDFGQEDVLGIAAVARYEQAFRQAAHRGITVKALLLCSPHNPLGQCYAPDVLEEYLAFCSSHKIHLISDEVYAMSVFPHKGNSNPTPFRSVLSLDYEKLIDPSLLHVLYGMSKDFCSNGIRIGAFVSPRNPELHRAIRAVSKFAWSSSLADTAWSRLLSDKSFLDNYLPLLTERLTNAFEVCTGLLRELGIPYKDSNCGPFLWADFSSFLQEKTIQAERQLAWSMINAGVWLATGEAYRSEAPGWFRITFAVPEEQLRLGMKRYMLTRKTLFYPITSE